MPRIPKYVIETDRYRAVLVGVKHRKLQWKVYRVMRGITIKYMPFIAEGTADEIIIYCDEEFNKKPYVAKK